MFTLIRLLFLPAKVGVGTTKLGVKTGYRAGRARRRPAARSSSARASASACWSRR